MSEEKKIIVESIDGSKEISKEKLEEMKTNPDYMVNVLKEDEKETVVNIKQRLYD